MPDLAMLYAIGTLASFLYLLLGYRVELDAALETPEARNKSPETVAFAMTLVMLISAIFWPLLVLSLLIKRPW